MKKILLYIILFLSGIDGAWALPIEKEGMSIYSPSLKQEVSYSIILPEGYEHSETEYPVLYMFHGIGGDYTSWLEYGNVARVMDKMIKEGKIKKIYKGTRRVDIYGAQILELLKKEQNTEII